MSQIWCVSFPTPFSLNCYHDWKFNLKVKFLQKLFKWPKKCRIFSKITILEFVSGNLVCLFFFPSFVSIYSFYLSNPLAVWSVFFSSIKVFLLFWQIGRFYHCVSYWCYFISLEHEWLVIQPTLGHIKVLISIELPE